MLRNATGYLTDCERLGLQPSALQMIVIFDDATSLLSLPVLDRLPYWMFIPIHRGLALFGEYVMG